MNLIYKITFITREQNNEFPCYYIGSKVDATFNGQNILDKNNKIYTGSPNSKYTKLYNELIDSGGYIVTIIGETKQDPRKIENIFQMSVKAVTNEKYFNKTYAHDQSRYDAPGYAPYRNLKTGKVVKLHPSELTSDYVGVRKGCSISDKHIQAIKDFQKEYWTAEARQKRSIEVKNRYKDAEYALKFKAIMNTPEVYEKYLKSITEYWNNSDNRIKASKRATERNASPEFKEKFRKSKARGTWLQYEDELKALWNALGQPGYIKFRKHAIEHGFNDENYQGAIRSWSNYYVNRKMK